MEDQAEPVVYHEPDGIRGYVREMNKAAEAVTEQELPTLEASEMAVKVPTAAKALKVWAAGTLSLTGSLPEGGQVAWSASPAENVDLDPETGHYVLLKEGTVTFTATITAPAAAEEAAEEGQTEPVTKTAEITVSPAGAWTLVDGVTRYYPNNAASAEAFYKGWHETSRDCWTYFDVTTGRQNPKDEKTVKGDFWDYTPVSKDSNSGKSATISGNTVKVVGDVSGKAITFKKGTYYFDANGLAVIKGTYPTSNKNGFYYLKDNFIYVNTSGVVASGWTMISGNVRYFDPTKHTIVYGDSNGWKAGLPAGTVYDGDTNKAVKDPYSSGNMKIPADKETQPEHRYPGQELLEDRQQLQVLVQGQRPQGDGLVEDGQEDLLHHQEDRLLQGHQADRRQVLRLQGFRRYVQLRLGQGQGQISLFQAHHR